jgi:hypothetical protein
VCPETSVTNYHSTQRNIPENRSPHLTIPQFAWKEKRLSALTDLHLAIVTGALMQLMMNVGSMFSYSLGPYVSYTTLGVLSAIFPVIYLVLMLFMPETPYFLLMQGRREEAEASLMRLRGETNRQNIQVRSTVDTSDTEVSLHLGNQT